MTMLASMGMQTAIPYTIRTYICTIIIYKNTSNHQFTSTNYANMSELAEQNPAALAMYARFRHGALLTIAG